jgi:6-phosphogluconolactonase
MTAKHDLSLFDRNEDMTAALVEHARRVLNARQRQTFLLSGGSSPCDFYEALGQEDLPWAEIDLALVDERWVDEDDTGSNAALIKRRLMAGAANAATFTPMKTSAATPHLAAAEIDERYRALPQPSLIILGMGPDTHTASWFAEASEYEAVSRANAPQMVAGLTAPQSSVTGDYLQRMTITGAMLALCREAFLIIKGDSKISLLEDCLSSPSAASPIARAATILGARLQIFALRGDG